MDLSDLLVSEDGEIVLDLSAVYSQALMSVIDDIALSWFDYVMGFQVLDALDRVLFPFRDAVAALAAFLLGDEAVYSAVPYVEKTMELAGIDPDEYSRPGAGTSAVSAAGITVTVENPTSDVLSKGWLRDFGKRYTGETNFIMDFILDVLRRASVSLAENMDLGTVSVPVDAYDDSPFLDALAELFDRAVSDGMSAVEDTISESLSSGTVYDPFYGAIADEIQSHADEFVLSSELESRLVSAWTAAIPEGSGITPAMLAESGAVERAVHAYEASVHADLALFDELRRVADGDGVVKRVLSEICAFGLGLIGITDCVPERMKVMCDEILAMNAMNPHGGVTELPGTTGFRLEDGSGMTILESLDAEVSGSLIVGNVSIDRDRCVHTVGFREDSSAAYSTVIVTERGAQSTSVGVTQVNKGFDSRYDATSGYLTRMTRWMPLIALAVGLLLGVMSVRRRRLEYAGALHSGQSKGAQLFGIAVETTVWAGLATAASCSLLAAACVRLAASDPLTVLGAAIRTPLALLAGTVCAALASGLLIRESQLFRYFKNR